MISEETDRGLLLRHRSLPDLGRLGVVLPAGSAVRDLVAFLAKGRTRQELEAEFGDVDDVLRTLAGAGLLAGDEVEEAALASMGHARSMARLSESLCYELHALGLLPFRSGSPLEPSLHEIREQLEKILDELRELRGPYLEQQLERLGLTQSERGLKIHLACGPHRLAGWINADMEPAPLRLDLRWRLPFEDGAASHVYMAHALEHFRYKEDARSVLREIHRVLAPGGVLRVVVPDIELCLRAYVEDDEEFFEARKELWPWARQCRTRLEHFLAYAGASAPPGDAGHKYGYDFETLEALLCDVGFRSVTRSGFMESPDPALRIDEASTGAEFRHRDGAFSLFVEATR